jgi:CBS domain-containing protein
MDADDPTVTELMTSPVLTVSPDTTLAEVADGMADLGINSVVVIDDACYPTGILTSTDFVRAARDGRTPADTTVGEYMATDVLTVDPDDGVTAVADRMIENDLNHLPVVEDDTVVGILTSTDLAAYLADRRVPAPETE